MPKASHGRPVSRETLSSEIYTWSQTRKDVMCLLAMILAYSLRHTFQLWRTLHRHFCVQQGWSQRPPLPPQKTKPNQNSGGIPNVCMHLSCLSFLFFPFIHTARDNSYPPPFLVQQKLRIPSQIRQAAATMTLPRKWASKCKNLHGLFVIHKNIRTETRIPSGISSRKMPVCCTSGHIFPGTCK